MSRHPDRSIRHRPVCPGCDKPMGRVSRVARELIGPDESLINRQFECAECGERARLTTRVVETVVQATSSL